ncbi:unnamed protein product, partial [Prunus brigantina]
HRLHRKTSKNSSLCHRRSLLTIEEALCHRLQQTRTISETELSHPSPSLQTRKPLKVLGSSNLVLRKWIIASVDCHRNDYIASVVVHRIETGTLTEFISVFQ